VWAIGYDQNPSKLVAMNKGFGMPIPKKKKNSSQYSGSLVTVACG